MCVHVFVFCIPRPRTIATFSSASLAGFLDSDTGRALALHEPVLSHIFAASRQHSLPFLFVSTDIIFFLLPTIDFYRYRAFICLQLLVIVFSREVHHIENSHTPHKVLRRTMHTYRFHSHRHRSHTAPGRYLLASAYAFACTPEITHLYCVLHTNLRRKLFQTTQDRSGDSTESTTVLRVALNFAVHAFIFSIIIFLLLLVLDSIIMVPSLQHLQRLS